MVFIFSLDYVVYLSWFHVDTGDLQQLKQTPQPSRADQWNQAVTLPLFCHLECPYDHS